MKRLLDLFPPPGVLVVALCVAVPTHAVLRDDVGTGNPEREGGSSTEKRADRGAAPDTSRSIDAFDADLAAIAARPLFQEGRRPPTPPPATPEPEALPEPVLEAAPEQAAPPPPVPAVSMVGFRDMGNGPEALLRLPESPNEAWYRVGDTIGGWNISAVDRNRLHIRSGALETTIQMFE